MTRASFQDGILLENMHDVPYVKSNRLGPETVAVMSRVTLEVKQIFLAARKPVPFGLQILACGSREALAVAKACQCQFIRNEGFVFSHIGDEGFIDSNAGDLLRYRKQIDAEDVLVFSDIKKKHSSHSITEDVSLAETADAAKFFLADGIILTGRSTGDSTDAKDLDQLYRKNMQIPLLIGSGVTEANLSDYFSMADALIIGSHFKEDGHWANKLSGHNINAFMDHVKHLREKNK